MRMRPAARMAGFCAVIAAGWLGVAGMGGTVFAGGPVAKDVPADAKAYMHLDVEALRHTKLYEAYQAAVTEGREPPPRKALEAFTAVAGFDPLTDLDGITMYTTTMHEREGVVLMYGKINRDDIEKRVRLFARHAEAAYGTHTIHTWWDAKNERMVAGTVYSDKCVVAGDSAERVKAAVDWLDKPAAGAAAGGSELAQRFPKGAIFHAAVDPLGALAVRPESRALANAKSLDLTVTDVGGTMMGTLAVEAVDARAALRLTKLIEGIKATAALNVDEATSPMTTKILEALTVQAQGTTVTVSLKHDGRSLLRDLRALREERAAAQNPPPATAKQPGKN